MLNPSIRCDTSHMEFLNLPIIAAARSTPLKLQFPKPPATKKTITHRSLRTDFQLPNYVANQAVESCAPFLRVFCKVLLFFVLICFVWFCLAQFFFLSKCVRGSCLCFYINWLLLLFCSSFIYICGTHTTHSHTQKPHTDFVLFDGGLRIWFCLPSVFVDCLSFLLFSFFGFSFVFLVYLFMFPFPSFPFFSSILYLSFWKSAVYDLECIKSQVQLFQYNLSNN